MKYSWPCLVLAFSLAGCVEYCPTISPGLKEPNVLVAYVPRGDVRGEAVTTSFRSARVDTNAADSAIETSRDDDPIRPHGPNPSFWEYKGRPVLLLGGSKNDNLFQSDGLEEHLDLLVSVGGNYVRNTMSSRDSGDVAAFHRLPDGRYDLERFNDTYFQRFETLLQLAVERDVIVQIELWDRFDFGPPYDDSGWEANPYRPANNVNYTTEESGLADAYLEHPSVNENPFFRSVPAENDNTVLLRYQRAQVDTLLDVSLRYPNVLYTMDNETSASAEWAAYWADYVKKRAAEAGVEVYTTEMWDARDPKDEQHRRTFDYPDTYAFADLSQNSHNTNQEHWDNLQWVRRYVADQLRPLNHVKTYGADGGRYGTTRDAVERFWRTLMGGAASVRFHRPPSGIGLNETAQAQLRSARMFLDAFDVMTAVPDAESKLLSDRSPNEAYVTYDADNRYAVYFTDGGSVKLDLCNIEGTFDVRWLDLEKSAWHVAQTVESGARIQLTPPEKGHWIVVLTRSHLVSEGDGT